MVAVEFPGVGIMRVPAHRLDTVRAVASEMALAVREPLPC